MNNKQLLNLFDYPDTPESKSDQRSSAVSAAQRRAHALQITQQPRGVDGLTAGERAILMSLRQAGYELVSAYGYRRYITARAA